MSYSPSSRLTDWRDRVSERTRSPWPGPRPMRAGRDLQSALVGRDRDSENFARMVKDFDVTVFTGNSGVGKSSMLEIGLLPTLETAGWRVLLCNQWSRLADGVTLDELLFEQNADRMPALVRLGSDGGKSLLSTLDRTFPDRSVVVLDQFEELIRDQRRDFQRALRWIENAASTTSVRIVISLRVEHEHELNGPYGLKVGPFRQTRFELGPITDLSDIRQIITGANQGRSVHPISETATKALLLSWENAGAPDGPSDRSLLHLQALLFVLWMGRESETIQEADVIRLRRELGLSSQSGGELTQAEDARLYFNALTRAVAVSLSACQEACSPDASAKWAGLDPVLTSRAWDMLQAMSGHLSSGGYKVSLSREALAGLVIFREGSSALARFADEVEAARKRLAYHVDMAAFGRSVDGIDWLNVPRSVLLDEPTPRGLPHEFGERPWELDEHDLTGGVMMGLRPRDALVEEFRAFYFALEWLRTTELVRLTTSSRGQTLITLVHDLFGDGLDQWSTSAVRGADAAVHQFSAVRGVEMDWRSSKAPSSISDPVVANLRWRACDVSADLKGTTFVNCDFRGTRFHDSSFEGVAFVNCMLDDVEFVKCSIVGSASRVLAPQTTRSASPPAFFIPHVPAPVIQSLQRYRELPTFGGEAGRLGLYSQMAGLVAVPARVGDDPSQAVFEPQVGGLSMFGGRVSSLKVRACDFGSTGRLSLHRVAGTSVEFADQLEARLDIDGAAIRGLTVTRPIDAEPDNSRRGGAEQDPFDIAITDSRIVNLWFGIGLRGHASIEGRIWQLFNAADREKFEVSVSDDSVVHGLVNVAPFLGERAGFQENSLGRLVGEVELASHIIDYRERPLASELSSSAAVGRT